jgi:hypothetical protein
MRHGGESKHGSMQHGGMPWGIQPGYIIDEMAAAVEWTRQRGVKTIERLFGDVTDDQLIDLALKTPDPAYLILYRGGQYTAHGTTGSRFKLAPTFLVLAISSNWRSGQDRVEGRNVYYPSCESMIAWAMHDMTYRFLDNREVAHLHPVAEEPFLHHRSRYIYTLEFACTIDRNLFENPYGVQLEQLGLVHNPQPEPAPLFEDDDVTPNSDDATNESPNVTEFTDGE